MYPYFIRVDVHPKYEDGIKKLEEISERCFGVYHTGINNNNPHWHFMAVTDAKSVPCIRARLRKFWGVPKSLCIKSVYEERGTCVYMYKEKNKESFRVVSSKGFSEEDLNSFKEESYTQDSQGSQQSKSSKREPTFSEKLVQKAIEEFGTNKDYTPMGVNSVCQNRLMKWVMVQFGAHKRVWDEYVIYKAFNLVAQNVYGEKYLDQMLQKIHVVVEKNKYMPNF